MKRLLFLMMSAFVSITLVSQNVQNLPLNGALNFSKQVGNKILSGKLFESILNAEKLSSGNLKSVSVITSRVILYFDSYPSTNQIQELENLGVTLFFETWTPPVEEHPYGFLVATIPVENIGKILELSSVKKVDTGERTSKAMNNIASQSINAQIAWANGYTGKGKKICILDSGLDTTYKGSDLPATFESKDYSYFPLLDNDIANKATGHGTHVTGTALGRGVLSEGQNQINNGKGAFKGMAPNADLVFLKIGQDKDGISEDPPTIAAIDAAVTVYHADIISMSYGGWEDYHDGSSALEQKVDWAYSQGVPFFCSAGNDADHNKHWMGTVAANSQSDFIELRVSEPGIDSTMLRFNMVWSDGEKRNDLSLLYFDGAKNALGNVTQLPATESLKGTESRYSYYNIPLHSAGTYYLKVVNHSNFSQAVHLFEDWNNQRIGSDHVYFTNPEPLYTIGAPASAIHAFAVGAYISRPIWTSYNGNDRWYGATSVYGNIAPFSSLGPTMDQRIKPDICAPGSVIISLRDKDVYKIENNAWVDNDGVTGGNANYIVLRGTSMACPVVSGAAALYLEKYPDATPQQVYDAMKNFSDQSGLDNIPNNTWGSGRLDINYAMEGIHNPFIINGDMGEEQYKTLASFTSGRKGSGNGNRLGELKYFSDGKNLYIGITGEVTSNDNILLFMDFSGVQGRGTNTLGGGNSGDFVDCAFSYLGNVKMDFDVDFALGFSKKNSTMSQFYIDAIRYGTSNVAANIGKTNQMGASSTYEIGSLFGGSGFITVAYDSSYSVNNKKGVEVKIPISAFAGVDTSQTLRMFAVISSMTGNISNECIPSDPGANNLGDGADFSVIPNQDFFTSPVKIAAPQATTLIISNEEGGLISRLIASGFGNSNFYSVMSGLKPNSGGVISDAFMAALTHCPAGSEIFTSTLNDFSGLNNSVGINTDGTVINTDIHVKDYYHKTGFNTFYNSASIYTIFTYSSGPDYFIDTNIPVEEGSIIENINETYKAFAIVWSIADSVFCSLDKDNTATIKVNSRVNWSVTCDQPWITISPSSGIDTCTVKSTAQPNPTTSERKATVTIWVNGGIFKVIIVTQPTGAANLTVSPTTLNVAPAAGSTSKFTVNSNTNWSVSSDQSWLTFNPSSGTGNDTVTVITQVNLTSNKRIAKLIISATGAASDTVTVTQAAVEASLAVSTTAVNIAAAAGNKADFSIYSNSNWTITSDKTWLTINPVSGIGNRSVNLTAEANPLLTTRSAIVTVSASGVASKTITVTQAASEVTLSVSTTNLSVASASGSTTTFNVTSNINWIASSNQTWLVVTPLTGIGNGNVTVTAEENLSPTERTATITISATGVASKTVTVTQITGAVTLSVSPNILGISAIAGDTAFAVQSNITWTASSDQPWLTINPSTGTGNGIVTINAEENKTVTERNAIVTVSADGVASKTVTIKQAAGAATLSVSPSTLVIDPGSWSTASFSITSNTTWLVASDQTWLTADQVAGIGNGTVTLTAERNPTTHDRTAIVTISVNGIASQIINITQIAWVGISKKNIVEVSVYPNPFTGGFFVDTNSQESIVTVFDIRGRIILTRKVSGIEFIPAQQMENGLYLMEMKSDQFTVRKKLLKR